MTRGNNYPAILLLSQAELQQSSFFFFFFLNRSSEISLDTFKLSEVEIKGRRGLSEKTD